MEERIPPGQSCLVQVRPIAAKHLCDERLSMKGIPRKLRKITDAFFESKGIEVKVKPISILDENFQKNVGKPTGLRQRRRN